MATLSQAKTLGGVGSILVLLTVVPAVGWVLAIVGFIMTLVAVKYISDVIGDPSIFNNMLIGVILAIVGVAVAAIVVLGVLFSFFGVGFMNGGLSGVGSYGTNPFSSGVAPVDIISLFATLAVGLAIVWIAYIISAFFIRKSYSSVAKHVNVGLFGTAALLYLVGAALTIILVGFVLIFVAQILLIVAFFSLPDQLPQQTTAPATYPPPPPPMSSP